MPVINYRLDRMSGERTNVVAESVDINSNFTIKSVKLDKDPAIGEFLRVFFEFSVEYKPNLGNMKFEGNVWYYSKNLREDIEEKKESIKLKPEVVKKISIAIIRDSLLEGVEFSRKLRLPVPIRMPKFDIKTKEVEFPKK
ncbi:MAG: hypothetical protein DRO95_04090 [Candidatus Altiarchaeales archaeon]|nr:MAG: hypothetical protein DRO95_04090 [Candidatus Altiarchaeales archaeon]HDO81886.1 hypothetical protein [Candidatus Altiarchaeales archaeon]HEX54535.1 hypothetical protein [Candidatus Altiarchaeales archaeon]